MNLADVMDEVAAQLDTIAGLRVFAFPPDSLSPPAAWLAYPSDYTFDATYGRGADEINNLGVVVVVGKVSDRSSRDQVGAYADGSGAKSVKAVVEAGTHTAFDVVRVTGVTFDVVNRGGNDYLAALFMLDIIGPGSA